MKIFGGGGGDKPNPSPNETLEASSGEISSAVMSALNLAKGYAERVNIKHGLIKVAIDTTFWFQQKSDESARDSFKGMFSQEAEETKKLGIESEAIGKEAGIWGLKFSLEGSHTPQDLKHKLNTGLFAFLIENENLLRKIYDQNKTSEGLTEDFEHRLDNEANKSKWLRTLGKFREKDTNTAVKELGVKFIDGQPVNRSRSEFEPLLQSDMKGAFNVVTTHKGDLQNARNFAQVAENQPIANIIIVTKTNILGEKEVDYVEVWFPHYTTNGKQGIRLLEKLISTTNLETASRDLLTTEILREKSLKTKDGMEIPIYDVSTDYKVSPEENALKKEAVGKFKPRMKETVLQTLGWTTLFENKSGYICVDPLDDMLSNRNQEGVENNNDRRPAPAELQLAFVAGPLELEAFKTETNLFTSNNGAKTTTDFRKLIDSLKKLNINNSLEYENKMTQDEFIRASQGRGTVGVLLAHLPNAVRSFFKFIYSKENQIISEGAIQVSKIETSILRGVHFISALNARTHSANAEIKSLDGSRQNLRVRTDSKKYLEIFNKAKTLLPDWRRPHKDDIEHLIKMDVKEKVIEYRKFMVILSLYIAITQGEPVTEEKKTELIEMAQKAYSNIS